MSMQIQNQQLLRQYKVNEPQTPPKAGEVTSIVIKERKDNQEALVQIKGSEQTVKFEGPIPKGDRALVEVVKNDKDGIVLRAVTSSQVKALTVDDILQKLGFSPSANPDLKQIALLLMKNGTPITKDILNNINQFLKSDIGSIEQKIDTIKILLQKNLEMTKLNLRTVNEALNGKPLTDSLLEIAKKLDHSFQLKDEAAVQIKTQENIRYKSDIVQNPTHIDEDFMEAAKALLKAIEHEASITTILDKVGQFLSEHGDGNEVLKEAYDKAMKFAEQSRELAARRELTNALSQLEQKLGLNNSDLLSDIEQYAINEALQSLQLNAKNIEVTHISKRLSQMAIDFKKIKRDMTQSLAMLSKLLEHNEQQTKPQMKQMLEATIQKLDKTILKSDMMLYTDMTQEKTLLKASSRLQEAKNLLEKGEFVEANKIVKDVKNVIEKMMFKPADVKIKHFISDQSLEQTLPNQLGEIVRPSREQSARNVFEMIRKLGLTHEHDAAQSLISNERLHSDQNIKAALLKLRDVGGQFAQTADQALTNLTGQQLLNKQDSSGMQNLFFELPILLNKQPENVKVYINSRKNSEKIDWENCSLYFVLETKKLGQMGILLSAQNRNLTVTFKSNKELLQEKVETLTEVSKERLKEIGYHLSSIQVRKDFKNQEEIKPTKLQTVLPTFTEKGYDFTI